MAIECLDGGGSLKLHGLIYVAIFVASYKGGGTGGAGGAIAPPLFTDHFKNYILFDYSDRKLLLTFLTQKQV